MLAPKIVVAGSINIDLVVDLPVLPKPNETLIGGELKVAVGGKGHNQAVALARLGRRVYRQVVVEKEDPRGRRYFWIAGTPEWSDDEGTDHHALIHGLASVTPLHLDLTDYRALDRLAGHPFALALPQVAGAATLECLRRWAQEHADRIAATYRTNASHLALDWPGEKRAGYPLNLFNSRAIAEAGVPRYVPSVELTARQIASLLERYAKPVIDDEPARTGIVQFGGIPGGTLPERHIAQVEAVRALGAHHIYHHDMFQRGYGYATTPPSGVPDPDYSPFHRRVFGYLRDHRRW